MNAMALRLPDLTFVDPYAGLPTSGPVLRTPGPPEVSFGDDPLRMMRAARFVAQLGFVPRPRSFAAMTEMAPTLEIVSAERIRDELDQAPSRRPPPSGPGGARPTPAWRHTSCPSCRPSSSRWTSTTATRTSTSTVSPCSTRRSPRGAGDLPGPDLVLRLAALLHDIGKPATRRFEPGGGVSFHHHEVVGAKLVAKRMRALRFDKETIKAVSRLVELHLRFHGYGEGQWSDSAVRRYVTDAGAAAAAAAPAHAGRLHHPQCAQGAPVGRHL
jgi:poly(A) polymerase